MIKIEFLIKKLKEYTDKVENGTASKTDIKNYVVIVRLICRYNQNAYLSASEEYNSFNHRCKLMRKSGIAMPLADAWLNRLKERLKRAKDLQTSAGCIACSALTAWQAAGATLQEFSNLCNCGYSKALEYANDSDKGVDFVKLIFVNNLDYKNPRETGWIEDYVDAPFTHTIKEYMMEAILQNDEARQKMEDGLFEFFPGLREKAFRIYTDEDGTEHFIDMDGVERQPEELLSAD